MFEDTIKYLSNTINPPKNKAEAERVIDLLTRGQAILTKRTRDKPYCRVEFFCEREEISAQVRDGVFNYEKDILEQLK